MRNWLGYPVRVIGALIALAGLFACSTVVAPPAETSSTSALSLTKNAPSPSEIYTKLAPSVAFIETETGTGSGPIVELEGDKYVLTNAHVMWPYTTARIVLSNGDEYGDVPLIQTDTLVDLALLGPLNTSVPALALDTEQELTPGEVVYLIGYPGEGELFPLPAIAKGIISRTRVWQAVDSLRYYQTDTAGSGGQSGGILVSEAGNVIGISGMLFAEAFVLSTSSRDIAPRVAEMLQTEDEFVRGAMPVRLQKKSLRNELENYWDTAGFIIDTPIDANLEVEVFSEGDYRIALFDTYGVELTNSDQGFVGSEIVSTTTTIDGPHFATIEQYSTGSSKYRLHSTHRFEQIDDPDDGQYIAAGDVVFGSIDYPGDTDWFILPLRRGERVVLGVESTAIDASVGVGLLGSSIEGYTRDDDSGRGLLGANSLLEYRARSEGDYLVVVRAFGDEEMGGFILMVDPAQP